MNERLHDGREDLAFLRRELEYPRKYMYDDNKRLALPMGTLYHDIGAVLDDVAKDSRMLQLYLMDTFQLWMAILTFENTLLNIDQAVVNSQIARASETQAREAVKQADANNKILESSRKLAQGSEARAKEAVEQAKATNAIMETNNKLVNASVQQARDSNAILAANNKMAAASVTQAEATRKI